MFNTISLPLSIILLAILVCWWQWWRRFLLGLHGTAADAVQAASIIFFRRLKNKKVGYS